MNEPKDKKRPILLEEDNETKDEPETLSSIMRKIIYSIVTFIFMCGCLIAAMLIFEPGSKGEKTIITIMGFMLFSELCVIWKKRDSND